MISKNREFMETMNSKYSVDDLKQTSSVTAEIFEDLMHKKDLESSSGIATRFLEHTVTCRSFTDRH